MLDTRKCGVLLNPTSLPGPYGMGELGPETLKFIDALVSMGQRLWQILPLGVTGYGDSPYQSFSTFAGNPLWISFDWLVEEKLISKGSLRNVPAFPADHVDYGPVIEFRNKILAIVCRDFDKYVSPQKKAAFRAYAENNKSWLDDFALFMALKQENNMRPWPEWAPDLVRRDPKALARAREELNDAVRNAKILQFIFDEHWKRVRAYCHQHDVRIIGDIPIFVAHDSADAWAHPELFYLKPDGHPNVVAGVPPDYFSATGQLWGNPLYRWDYHKKTDYAWWAARMKKIFEMVDVVRIDHFRGFEAYWEVQGDAPTAIKGKWVKGPGLELFDALKRHLGQVPVIAEDLGIITAEVDALREATGFPGMRVLHFAFGNDAKAQEYRPHNYVPNCVVYTGTHDNDTTVGWFNSEAGLNSTRSAKEIEAEHKTILDYIGKKDGREIHWDMIELALRSKANTAIVPMQDVLGLGSAARMNTPGTSSGNWQWRFQWPQLTPAIKQRMCALAIASGRA